LLDPDILMYFVYVQYPRLFSMGTFSKTGPSRKQASLLHIETYLDAVMKQKAFKEYKPLQYLKNCCVKFYLYIKNIFFLQECN